LADVHQQRRFIPLSMPLANSAVVMSAPTTRTHTSADSNRRKRKPDPGRFDLLVKQAIRLNGALEALPGSCPEQVEHGRIARDHHRVDIAQPNAALLPMEPSSSSILCTIVCLSASPRR
jgi:hypothetical protein